LTYDLYWKPHDQISLWTAQMRGRLPLVWYYYLHHHCYWFGLHASCSTDYGIVASVSTLHLLPYLPLFSSTMFVSVQMQIGLDITRQRIHTITQPLFFLSAVGKQIAIAINIFTRTLMSSFVWVRIVRLIDTIFVLK